MKKLLLASVVILSACTTAPDTWDPYYAEEMADRGWTLVGEVIHFNGQSVFDLNSTCPGRYGSHKCGEYIGPPGLYDDVIDRYTTDLEASIAEQLEKDRNILALPKKDG